jgi:hypothetical protein
LAEGGFQAKEENLIVVSIGSDEGHKISDLPLFMRLAKAAAGNRFKFIRIYFVLDIVSLLVLLTVIVINFISRD